MSKLLLVMSITEYDQFRDIVFRALYPEGVEKQKGEGGKGDIKGRKRGHYSIRGPSESEAP